MALHLRLILVLVCPAVGGCLFPRPPYFCWEGDSRCGASEAPHRLFWDRKLKNGPGRAVTGDALNPIREISDLYPYARKWVTLGGVVNHVKEGSAARHLNVDMGPPGWPNYSVTCLLVESQFEKASALKPGDPVRVIAFVDIHSGSPYLCGCVLQESTLIR